MIRLSSSKGRIAVIAHLRALADAARVGIADPDQQALLEELGEELGIDLVCPASGRLTGTTKFLEFRAAAALDAVAEFMCAAETCSTQAPRALGVRADALRDEL